MLIYTIGIGTIFSVTTPGISTDEIYAQQKIAYEAFFKQALGYEEKRWGVINGVHYEKWNCCLSV